MEIRVLFYGLLGLIASLGVTFLAWYALWKGIISQNEIVQSIMNTQIEQKRE